MRYTSKSGCVFYYDRVTYSWRICDVTMLFLLGFEAVTIYNNSPSDALTIPKYAYYTYTQTEFEPLHDFNIFDDIYYYLSRNNQIEDYETYARSNCYGMKLLFNEYTGTGDDRTVPIIFFNDVNNKAINLNARMYRIPESDLVNKSKYDLQAQKIHDIFEDADFNDDYDPIDIGNIFSNQEKLAAAEIDKYNSNFNKERKSNSQLFKLLDYKAMYSYALGVLYGCRCLGYDEQLIWRVHPSFWYDGNYKNLVYSAWDVFRFHYENNIDYSDEFYTNIRNNFLWNFTNDNTSDVSLKENEKMLYCASVVNEEVIFDPIIYSSFTGEEIYCEDGTYLSDFDSDDFKNQVWSPISDKVSDDPELGIISSDDYIVRYIGANEIKFFHAQSGNVNQLSPTGCNYFTTAGYLGWVNFDKDTWKSFVYPVNSTMPPPYKGYPTLSQFPINALEVNNNITHYLSTAISRTNGEIVDCYKCYFTTENNNPNLIGVARRYPATVFRAFFDEILSYNDFQSQYSEAPQSATTLECYDLSMLVSVFTDLSGENVYIDATNTIPFAWTGYSLTPSIEVIIYANSISDSPNSTTIRYESSSGKYWVESDEHHEWINNFPNDSYTRNSVTDLYLNESEIAEAEPRYIKSNNSNDTFYYIFNNASIVEISDLSHGFISLSDLYDNGITVYPCTIVEFDDYGNSLLDEYGHPLVWYDSHTNKYWNGLFDLNIWQTSKPSLTGSLMYISNTNETKQVFDNPEVEKVTVDDVTYDYSDFYNNANYGIIRETLEVFNELAGTKDCYYDSYSEKYCIPTITSTWLTRQDIINLDYRFIDGQEILYDGDIPIEVLIDNDNTD